MPVTERSQVPQPPSHRSDVIYDTRILVGDVSLHSVVPTTLTKPQQQRLKSIIRESMKGDHNSGNIKQVSDVWIDGMTDDGGSFFTAKGTIKSIAPKSNGQAGKDETEEEVLVLVHEPRHVTPTAHQQEWSYGETPAPSRVLYLFHPPKPPSASYVSTNLNLNAWEWVESAMESLERAFWGILMPSVSGVVGVTEKVGNGFANIINILPSPATLSLEGTVAWETSTSIQNPTDPKPKKEDHKSTYNFSATASLRKEFQAKKHLYDQETIYTLRMPPNAVNGDRLDIGPTAKPVHVRKRSAIPQWNDNVDDGRHDLGLGRAVGMGIGMRV
ncbi:uncharacterized protein IL334_006505 [Kwoniella shivajii]|uniref:Uncharacterized protein n=1 Tax=Kwoniella shivajii TaxID=564305 RepID=A0ABZ1D662_9TREE|nr:hypothetical protein IL334_006505 [Kwoniella shivajii]